MRKNITLTLLSILAFCALFLTGCGVSKTTPSNKSSMSNPVKNAANTTEKAARLPEEIFSSTPIEKLSTLLEAKETAKVGDMVSFSGIIGGRKHPFVDGGAAMLVADNSLSICGPKCAFPWDACCQVASERLRITSTVQILNKNNEVFKVGLNGEKGLRAGNRVQVKGKVKMIGNGVFLVNATKIHVLPWKNLHPKKE